MANEAEDKITERHSHIITQDYAIGPRTTKCERTIRTSTDICTLWLCRKDGAVRCLVKYHADQVRAKQFEGNPCTACWSEGKFWEDETVPKYIFCALSGFQPPVEFLNEVYMLEQKNAPDCIYEHLDDDVEIIWTPNDVESTLVVTTKPDDIIRMNASAGGCFKLFKQNETQAEINYC